MSNELGGKTNIGNCNKGIIGKSGEKLSVILPVPICIADCHTHIESGSTVPLPLLWHRPFVPDVERKVLNFLAQISMPAAGSLQVKSTFEIGATLANEIRDAFSSQSIISYSEYYRNCEIFSFAVIHMMDMEYAWLGGFDGQTIYFEDETPWYFYEREHALDKKEEWRKRILPGENQKTFAKWETQLRQTLIVLKQNPLRLVGMYHYDPRRWNYPKRQDFDKIAIKGPWDYPFNEIISSGGKGLFIGFKMYPPLGYKPLDPRLPYLYDKSLDGDCFYGRCEREGIPIMVHCSPGGIYTHEMRHYLEYDGESIEVAIEDEIPEATRKRFFTPEGYFWRNYVHPKEWRKVLERFPNLKICLAHFGGGEWKIGVESDWIREIIALTKEYPNVYTDFSCWKLENAKENFAEVLNNKQYSHLKDKILFGTDWYMTLVALGGKSYRSFCEEFWEFFLGIPEGLYLWRRFTFINPFTFYGFFEKNEGEEKDKLDNLVEALRRNECDEDQLNENYSYLRRLQKGYEKLKGEIGK